MLLDCTIGSVIARRLWTRSGEEVLADGGPPVARKHDWTMDEYQLVEGIVMHTFNREAMVWIFLAT